MNLALAGTVLATMLAAASSSRSPDPKFAARDAGPGTVDVSAYPPEQQRNYASFAGKCSKCHPLARPVNSRFTEAEWKRYMKRMIRRPNSGINEEQAAKIFEFLKYYSVQVGP